MTDETPHAVRRSRHVGGDHEIVCRCGFVAKGVKARAEADFDAHVRIERLRREAPVVARGVLGAAVGDGASAVGGRRRPHRLSGGGLSGLSAGRRGWRAGKAGNGDSDRLRTPRPIRRTTAGAMEAAS